MLSEAVLQNFGALKIDNVQGGNTLMSDVQGILNAIIVALGIVCVVAILIGGIYYLTSAGDTSKVEKGKKTILYAAIGLAISALSFAIVNWTIGVIGGESGTGGGGEETTETQGTNTSNKQQTENKTVDVPKSTEAIKEQVQADAEDYVGGQNPYRNTYLKND